MLAGLSLLRPIREGSVSGPSPWLADSHILPVSLHNVWPLCLALCPVFSILVKCNSHAELESILMISFQFDYLCKDPLSK